jgi:hypothetical protein
MGGAPGLLDVLTGTSIEELLRFAYAATRLLPAGAVVGGAAVLAGVLGGVALRRARTEKRSLPSAPATVPWVLGAALLASPFAAPAEAAVLCRKGDSQRFVLRTDACRRHEHAVTLEALGLRRETTCVATLERAWHALDALRARLEGARALIARLQRQPWDGAETWLALERQALVQAIADLGGLADELGAAQAAPPIAELGQLVADGWAHPGAACDAAMALLPALEAALPVPPAP